MSEFDEQFHRSLYEEFGYMRGQGISWMGVGALKYPCDLWLYQEILFKVRPDLVIETGTHLGGSALFLAHMMDLIGNGHVMSIDVSHAMLKAEHPRITFYQGSSTDKATLDDVSDRVNAAQTVMVILDSDHSLVNVLAEMDAYGSMVTRDSYLIVEDTNLNEHPVAPAFGPGPWEAVHEWLPKHPEFEIDKTMHRFHVTFQPDGWLKRVR